MLTSGKRKYKPGFKDYVVCYALFSALLLLSVFTVFSIWRQALLAALLATGWEAYSVRTVYTLSMVVLGVLLFIAVFAAEIYLRGGMACQQVRRRFLRLLVPILVAFVGGVLLRQLALA